jgi:hypothetical protein
MILKDEKVDPYVRCYPGQYYLPSDTHDFEVEVVAYSQPMPA